MKITGSYYEKHMPYSEVYGLEDGSKLFMDDFNGFEYLKCWIQREDFTTSEYFTVQTIYSGKRNESGSFETIGFIDQYFREYMFEGFEDAVYDQEQSGAYREVVTFDSIEEKALTNGFDMLTNKELAQYVDEIHDWSHLDDADVDGFTFIEELADRAGLDREDYTDEVNGFDFEQLIEDGLKKLCKRGIVE